MDASEIHARRLNAKEVLTPMKDNNFIFPVPDGTVKTPGGDRRLRTVHLNQGSSWPRRRARSSSRRIKRTLFSNQLLFKMTLHGMMRKLKMVSGLLREIFIYRHHVEPRVKLYMPKEESFLVPLKYIDVTRTTHSSLDVMLEKYWWKTGK